MKASFLYGRFNLLHRGSTGVSESLGGFVLGVPQRSVEEFKSVHPTVDDDVLLQSIILPQEWALVGRYLRVSLKPMPVAEVTVCGQEADEAKNQATFEGIAGKKFWVSRRPQNARR